jgi:hypothetical protein
MWNCRPLLYSAQIQHTLCPMTLLACSCSGAYCCHSTQATGMPKTAPMIPLVSAADVSLNPCATVLVECMLCIAVHAAPASRLAEHTLLSTRCPPELLCVCSPEALAAVDHVGRVQQLAPSRDDAAIRQRVSAHSILDVLWCKSGGSSANTRHILCNNNILLSTAALVQAFCGLQCLLSWG